MAMDLGTAVAYLDLDLTAFNTGIETALSAVEGLTSAISGGGFAWSDFFVDAGKLATNFGNELTRGVTLPLVNLGSSAIDSMIEYESAFTGVKKTLDVGNRTAEETAQLYQELSDAIEDMATRTASTAPEIAEVAEIAGQLGISAEDLMKFTEVMVMLGDTTNLTSATAAESLAKFINITGTSKDDIDRLGASIVDLGNHFATNESDIVLMSTRLASAGTIAGLTERDILALSTAMSSVGIRAEAGGSSMSQTLAQIEKAVQMSISGDEGAIEVLNTLAQVSGMSAEEFSSAWMTDPMTALTSFLYGLGELDEQGESTVLILDELGMTGIRQSNMLKALGLAAGVLEDAVATSNEAWEENTALTNEAELRYGTLESQISQLNQEWEITKRELAEMLLPILRDLMDVARELIDWWRGLSDATKENIVQWLEFLAAVGPVLMIVGKLSTGLGLVLKIFEGIGNLGAIVIGFFQGLTGHVAGFAGATTTAGGALQSFGSIFQFVWSVIKQAFSMLAGGVQKIIGFIGNIGAAFIQHIVPIMKVVGGVSSVIAGIVMALTSFFDMWNNGFSAAKEVVMLLGIALTAVGAIILGAPAAVAGVVAAVVAALATAVIWIHDNWEQIKQWFSDGWQALKEMFMLAWDFIKNIFSNIWEFLTNFISKAWDAVTNFIKKLFENVGNFFKEVTTKALEFLGNILSKAKDFFSGLLNGAIDLFVSIVTKVAEFVGNVTGKIVEFFSGIFTKFAEFVGNLTGKIIGFFSNIVGKIVEFFGNVFGKIINFFAQAKSSLFNFISENAFTITNFFSNIFGKVGEFFGNIFGSIGQWFGNIWSKITGWFIDVFNWIGNFGKNFFDIGANIFNSLWNGLKSVWDKMTGWIVDAFNWMSDKLSGLWGKAKSFLGFDGSHANGLDYVPYDGYIAQLHKGERVLTKAENKEYGSNSGGNGGDTFNFYNTKPDPYTYARQMKRAKRELALG